MCLLKGETLLSSGMVYIHLLLLCHLSVIVCPEPPCRRKMLDSNDERTETEEVFTGGEEADMFLSRSLLYNRFDFEMFVPGNAERECYEEVCNYEEAREIFKDHATTTKFWREYSTKGPYAKPETVQKMDVTGLLTGLVATGAILIIFWFIGYYIYKYKCKTRRQRPGSTVNHARSQIRSSISRRLEHMFTPQHPPHPPPTTLNLEPPSYEEAVALNGSLETPPPSYPETIEEIQLFRKSTSLPAGQSH